MPYSTILEDLKSILEGGSFGSLTATFYIRAETDPVANDLRPRTLRGLATLATDKVVGILEADMASQSSPRATKSEREEAEGTLVVIAVSSANLKDFIEDLKNLAQARTQDTLRLYEPPVRYAQQDEAYWAVLRYRWVRVVVYT